MHTDNFGIEPNINQECSLKMCTTNNAMPFFSSWGVSISFSFAIPLFLYVVDVRVVSDSECIFIEFLVHYGNGDFKHIISMGHISWVI